MTLQNGAKPELESLITERAAARILAVAPGTLKGWRATRRGPPYLRLHSRTIRYRLSDIAAWVALQQEEVATGG